MDGRRLRRLCLYGGLLAGAVGCKNTYPDTMGFPKPGQTSSPTVSGQSKGSWGGPAAPPAEATTSRKSNKPPSAEFHATIAETHVAAALADPPPPNRDALLDKARQGYQLALKQDPKNKAALLGLAGMYARLGDRERAMEAYRAYLKHYPTEHAVAHDVALKHGWWKDWDGAVAWCDEALRLDPENRSYLKTKGYFLAMAGKWKDGFELTRRLMPEAQARHNMAGILKHQNYPDHSRQQLMLALQADPNYAPARDLLAELDQTAPQQQPAAPPTGPEANPVRQATYGQQ